MPHVFFQKLVHLHASHSVNVFAKTCKAAVQTTSQTSTISMIDWNIHQYLSILSHLYKIRCAASRCVSFPVECHFIIAPNLEASIALVVGNHAGLLVFLLLVTQFKLLFNLGEGRLVTWSLTKAKIMAKNSNIIFITLVEVKALKTANDSVSEKFRSDREQVIL